MKYFSVKIADSSKPMTLKSKLVSSIKSTLLHGYRAAHQLYKKPNDYIIVVCPARSGSTLLCNILLGCDEIAGFGEAKVRYQTNAAGLSELLFRVCWFLRKPWISERYLLDKTVFNEFTPDAKTALPHNVRWIFLLREVLDNQDSIKSYLNWQDKNSEGYLRKRYDYMAELHASVKDHQPCMTIQFEDLLDNPDNVLQRIEQFLALSQPLKSEYKLQPKGVNFAIGDVSKNIQSGRILSRQKKSRPDITTQQQQLQTVYSELLTKIDA